MRGKKTCLLRFLVIGLTILLFTTIITTTIKPIKANDENNPILGSTHTVFVEIGTSQNCKLCHDWNQNIHNIYTSGDYKFDYVEMIVFDHDGKVLNEKAKEWDKTYNIGAYPTSIFDGDYQRIVGNHPELLPNALDICRSRSVADITADMTLLWLENATIKIDIIIENKEQQQYNGHIRACVTEIVSRYDTYYGDPYHFGFLDYAFDKDITINANDVYIDNITWNGNEHYDGHGDNFGDIVSDNIQVTMGVINENNGFVDETVSARVGENSPPSEPDNPSPANGAKGVGLDDDIYWDCNDPDSDPINYDVYFGLTNPPPQVTWNQSSKSYDPDTMNKNTSYFWKIVAWDEYGLKATAAPVWNFMTQGNLPPDPPSNPFPENGANNVPTTGVILSWNGSDPNPGDTLKYNVYFGTDNPPKPDDLVSENQTGTTYNPGDLELYKTYYWRIVAWDSGKLSTNSQVWNFTTGINHQPTAPTITGPASGKVGVEHTFTFQSTDPDGNDVYYYIDWGDQTNTGWIGPYASGEEITQSHTWSEQGTFNIGARAKDTYGAKGDWSYLKFISPLNMQSSQQSLKSLYLKTLQQMLNLHRVIVEMKSVGR